MFHDVPQCIFLYLLDKGAADAEDLDLSKVATPDPVRSITGSFVGGAERIAMTAVKDSKGNTTHFEAVVEFLSTDEDRALYLRDGSSNLITYGCDADEFEFKDGVSFASVVNGDEIVVPDPETDEETGEPVAESVYYVVEQSYDGMTITITTPETPDGAQWDFEIPYGSIALPSVMDFGYTFDGFTWGFDLDTYSQGQAPKEMAGLYQMNEYLENYKFVPTSLTSGNLMIQQYSGDWGISMTYTNYDGDSFTATSASMMITEGVATLATKDCVFYIPNSPVGKQVIAPEGENYMVLDFGLELKDELAIGYLAFGENDVPYACYYSEELVGSEFSVDYASPTSGVITCSIPGMRRPIDIIFDAPDPTMIILTNEAMGWDKVRCEMYGADSALEFAPPYVPEANIDGQQWVGEFTDADDNTHTYLLDLGYSFKNKLVFAELVDGVYKFILDEEYVTEGDFNLFFASISEDNYFMFENPEEYNTGYVYNVYNETYFGADVPVEFVINTGEVEEPFDTPDLKQWNYTIGDNKAMLDLGTAVLGGYFGNEVEGAFTADNMWMPEVKEGDEVISPAGWYLMSTNVFKYSVKPNSSTDGVINVEGVWYPDEETFDAEGNADLILLEQVFEVPYKDYDGKSVKIYFPTDGSYYECVLAEEASETIIFSMGVM